MLAAAATAGALAVFTPVVVHDPRETSQLTAVADAPVRVPGLDPDPRPAVYGRAVRSAGGGTWLQYWLFYAQQDQDRGVLRSGRHAGDWEMVQYRLRPDGRPEQAVYAQHSGAERCSWSEVEQRGGRPVVYAARAAHGSYLHSGVRDRTWPDPNDEIDGRGTVVRPRLVVVRERSPAWMRWSGRWGGARARWWVPIEQDSPRGPAFQPDGRWSDPDAWARAAGDCRAACDSIDECDGRETAMGAGGAAALAGLGRMLWTRRRRRSRRAAAG